MSTQATEPGRTSAFLAPGYGSVLPTPYCLLPAFEGLRQLIYFQSLVQRKRRNIPVFIHLTKEQGVGGPLFLNA